MIDEDKKHAPDEDLSDDLFLHGTEERQRNFLRSVDVFQLLSEAALEWPGEEDQEWGQITGLAAYFYDKAVKNGEIDPKKLLDRMGNA